MTGAVQLSPRQRQVRDLLALGLTARQVAATLGISVQRVHQHIARLRALGELEGKR